MQNRTTEMKKQASQRPTVAYIRDVQLPVSAIYLGGWFCRQDIIPGTPGTNCTGM